MGYCFVYIKCVIQKMALGSFKNIGDPKKFIYPSLFISIKDIGYSKKNY